MSTTNMANMAEKCQQIAKTMQHFSFSCLLKFDFGIENLWNILLQKFDVSVDEWFPKSTHPH